MKTIAEVEAQLRPYQRDAYQVLVSAKRQLVYDDMRLGKTITTLAATHRLEAYPCLIICPKFALHVWAQEIKTWLDTDAVIYTGTPKQREKCWQQFIQSGAKFLITNPAQTANILKHTEEAKFHWGAFVADEIHLSGLFNHKTKTFKDTSKLTRAIDVRFLLTGTPYRQGIVDLYGPLNIIEPKKFNSYWAFVNRYGVVIQDRYGKSIERNPKDVKEFRSMLSKYMVRRIKTEVFADMPTKQRTVVPLEMNREQRQVYQELSEELMAIVPTSGEILMAPGVLPLLVRQRQLLACPQELGLQAPGTAIETIVEMAAQHFEAGEPFIVYTPFREAIKWVEKALLDAHGYYDCFKIQGKMTADEFRDSWQGFMNKKSRQKVMFIVIKSGAAFTASTASTGYFLGCEWDFTLNEQAEDRMFHVDKKETIQVNYLMYKGTVDDAVATALNDKKFSSDWVVGTEKQFTEQLQRLRKK